MSLSVRSFMAPCAVTRPLNPDGRVDSGLARAFKCMDTPDISRALQTDGKSLSGFSSRCSHNTAPAHTDDPDAPSSPQAPSRPRSRSHRSHRPATKDFVGGNFATSAARCATYVALAILTARPIAFRGLGWRQDTIPSCTCLAPRKDPHDGLLQFDQWVRITILALNPDSTLIHRSS